jgi:hypothetical protein
MRINTAIMSVAAMAGTAFAADPTGLFAVTYETIAKSGDPAPGFSDSRPLQGLSSAHIAINNAGDVLFFGYVDNGTSFTNCMFGPTSGHSVGLIHDYSGAALGLPQGVRLMNVRRVVLTEGSTVVFSSDLQGDGVDSQNDQAIFAPRPDGSMGVVARRGDPIPGMDGSIFTFINVEFDADASGRIVFVAGIGDAAETGTPDGAIFSYAGGELRVEARSGDELPGTFGAQGMRDFTGVTLADDGTIVAEGLSTEQATAGFYYPFIASLPNDHGDGQLIARWGHTAPALDLVPEYLGLHDPFHFETHPPNATTMFTADLGGNGIQPGNDRAIFVHSPATGAQMIAREGWAAPGIGWPTTIADLPLASIEPGASGHIAFKADLAGPDVVSGNRRAAFLYSPDGSVDMIFRDGQHDGRWAPPGPLLDSPDTRIRVNRHGDVAGQFENVEIIPQGGTPIVVFAAGMEINLSRDPSSPDIRTVQDFSFRNDFDFNDHRQLITSIPFTDGTEAIIVATLEQRCSIADTAQPYGTLTFADLSAFLAAFTASDPTADLADPANEFTFADITAFLTAFAAGCP